MLMARGMRGFGVFGPEITAESTADICRRVNCRGFGDLDAGPHLCRVEEILVDGTFMFSDGCVGPAAQMAAIARLPYDVVHAALARQRATAAGEPLLVGPPKPSGSIVVDGRAVTLPADMAPETKKGFPAWAKWTLGILAVAGAGALVWHRRRSA